MYCIVGPEAKKGFLSAKDWPQIEKRMKALYGEDWKLVTPDELREITKLEAKPDTPSR